MRLIDADKLKDYAYEVYQANGVELETIMIVPLSTINNAPTVEEKSYAMGYQDGLEDGLQDIRPQGEWIKVKEERMMVDMSGEIVTRYKCSECGRMIAILPSRLADYPFCHCGAAMQKGGME